MSLKHLMDLSLLAVFCGLTSAMAFSQESTALLKSVETDGSHFSVSTGVGLSFTGPTYFYEFRMVDENGFQYDTMSLVGNPEVVDHAGLSDDQIAEMNRIKETLNQELIGIIGKGITSADTKQKVKRRFGEVESDLRSVMRPDQLTKFDQVANQINIRQVGFEKFLSAQAARQTLQLNEADLKSIRLAKINVESKIKQGLMDLFRKSNLILIDQLSESQRSGFDELLDPEQKEEFLQVRLFPKGASEKKIRQLDPPDYLRWLANLKTLREQIQLTDPQLKQILELKSDRRMESDPEKKRAIEARLHDVLDRDQFEQLRSIAIQKEATRSGTVRAICGGELGRTLGLSEEDGLRVLEVAQQLNDSLVEQVQSLKADVWKETIRSLPESSQESILSMIGTPIAFDFE